MFRLLSKVKKNNCACENEMLFKLESYIISRVRKRGYACFEGLIFYKVKTYVYLTF